MAMPIQALVGLNTEHKACETAQLWLPPRKGEGARYGVVECVDGVW